jgi:flavin reductase (DIM6/NTAB) family NADH-FMN oxidoreductase RutF
MSVNAAPAASARPVADSAFRDAMRQLAGGVSVITAGIGDDRSGMTVISVSSLAVDPPSIVMCVNRQSSTWPLLHRYRVFGVNILGAGQQAVADRFTGRSGLNGPARYADAQWITLVTGAWLLSDALAALDCEVEELIDRHSHSIVIGRVKAVRVADSPAGLVYWRGRYSGTADLPGAAASGGP